MDVEFELQEISFRRPVNDEANNNTEEQQEEVAKVQRRVLDSPHPLRNGCEDTWTWNRRERSQEALLSGANRTVHFHPNWSKGTAGVRGTRILNNGRYYWELRLSDRIFGTR